MQILTANSPYIHNLSKLYGEGKFHIATKQYGMVMTQIISQQTRDKTVMSTREAENNTPNHRAIMDSK